MHDIDTRRTRISRHPLARAIRPAGSGAGKIRLAVYTLAAATVLSTGTPQAQDTMIVAKDLGMILASEEYCGLTYDQTAIASWIEQNVPVEDMGFASTLNTMTSGSRYLLEEQTTSQKTAHCTAIARTARKFGFVK